MPAASHGSHDVDVAVYDDDVAVYDDVVAVVFCREFSRL